MDLYILDQQLRRAGIVDVYNSFIWTERYSSFGDFELEIQNTRGNREMFAAGTCVTKSGSQVVMITETLEESKTEEGESILSVKGRDISTFLNDRVARPSNANLTTLPEWTLTGLPAEVVRNMFKTVCVDGGISSLDILPLYQTGTLNPAGNIPEPSESVTFVFNLDSLYSQIKDVCDQYNMGFRIVRKDELLASAKLYFEVYTGNDRTSSQSTFPAVVFSPNLDNLTNVNSVTSIAGYCNMAYVYAQNGFLIVPADGADPSAVGFDRKVLTVDASSIDLPAGAALNAAMLQKGREELAKHRAIIAFDGEISQYGSYRYGVDYGLGDMVEMRDIDGKTNLMRVTEHISVSDQEGERSYPTLSYDLLVTPGSWYAWAANQVWDEVTEYWDEV